MTTLIAAGSPLNAAVNKIQVVSAPGAVSRSGVGASFTPILSQDERHVAFISSAKDLVTNDNLAEYYDVFVRDLTASNTVLVSVNLAGTAGGNDHSTSPSVSSNAQWLAFASAASDLVAGDTNQASDIFVRDLSGGNTILVSVNIAGTGSGNGASVKPSISLDGRFVVFESTASDLVADDTNGASDVFIRDLALGTTTLISVSSSGIGSANGSSELLHVTPDGRFIAFRSMASNVTAEASSPGEIFVRDRDAGVTHWATVNLSNRNPAQPRRFLTALSHDGHYLVMEEDLDSASASASVYRHDLWTGLTATAPIAGRPDLFAPVISANGERIAFSGNPGLMIWELANDTAVRQIGTPGTEISDVRLSADGHTVLYVDRQYPSPGFQLWAWEDNSSSADGRTNLVSANIIGNPTVGDLRFTFANLSSNGNLVVFESTSDDFVEGDWNKASDIFVRDMTFGVTTLVSERHPALPAPSTGTALTKLYPGSLSANGRQLVFTSQDNVLVPFDTNYWQDLFLRDLVTGTNRGVSGPLLPMPPQTPPPQTPTNLVQSNSASRPIISADGRFVAFDLSYGYPNSLTNSYRFDGSTGAVLRVATDQNRQPREGSGASMSSDGRIIVFQTQEPLDALTCCSGYPPIGSDTSGFLDVASRDFHDPWLQTQYPGPPRAVSITSSNTAGNNASFQPAISPDGSWVLFQSLATDLTSNAVSSNPQAPHVFAHNLVTRKTKLVDRDTNGAPFPGGGGNLVFSLDSRYVFFESGSHAIFRHDLLHDAEITIERINCLPNNIGCRLHTNIMLLPNLLVCTNCSNASASGDGELVAYESLESATTNLVFRELGNQTTELISINSSGTGGGNGPSRTPLLSYDGHYVVFESKASDLTENDFNRGSDIFVRDRWSNRTLLISTNSFGASANGASSRPVLSADGHTLAFQSFASDLVPGDYNNTRDIFFVRLSCPDSDNDGLDDCWELHYFGSLAPAGTADSDGDGLSDRQEFQLGTSPVNAGSVLHCTSLSTATNYTDLGYILARETSVSWSATPGQAYRLQYKVNLQDLFWNTVPGDIIAGGTIASKRDYNFFGLRPLDTNRFYRVIGNPDPILPP